MTPTKNAIFKVPKIKVEPSKKKKKKLSDKTKLAGTTWENLKEVAMQDDY